MKKIISLVLTAIVIFSLFSCKGEEPADTSSKKSEETVNAVSEQLSALGFDKTLENSNSYFVTYVSYLDEDGSLFSDEEREAGYALLFMKEGEDSVTVLVFDSVVGAKRYRENYLVTYPNTPYSLKRDGAVIIVGNKKAVADITI